MTTFEPGDLVYASGELGTVVDVSKYEPRYYICPKDLHLSPFWCMSTNVFSADHPVVPEPEYVYGVLQYDGIVTELDHETWLLCDRSWVTHIGAKMVRWIKPELEVMD